MTKKKSVKARKAAHAAQANAARRPQQAPRLKIVADGLEIPARTAVLSTMELLEMILCDVDMITVLFAQRVNTKWRDIIGSSLPLRQLLFFAPIPRVPEARDEPPPPSTAPSQDHYAQPWVQRAMERAQRRKDARLGPTVPPTQNPLLKKNFGCMFVMLSSMSSGIRNWSTRGVASADVNYITTGKLMGMGMARGVQTIAGQGKPTSFLRAGASWRRMLVSQPPPRRLEYVRVADGRDWRGRGQWWAANDPVQNQLEHRSVDMPGGITMGQLYDLVHTITFDGPGGRLAWVGWPDGGKVIDPNATPYPRLMVEWARARSPYGKNFHDWVSTDCIIVGDEGVGLDFNGFCREHEDGAYVPQCRRCEEGQMMRRLKDRKRRLRKGVRGYAPFFRCDEYTMGGTLIEKEYYLSDVASSAGETDELDDQDSPEDPTLPDQAGDDSSDYVPWDAATDSDEELP